MSWAKIGFRRDRITLMVLVFHSGQIRCKTLRSFRLGGGGGASFGSPYSENQCLFQCKVNIQDFLQVSYHLVSLEFLWNLRMLWLRLLLVATSSATTSTTSIPTSTLLCQLHHEVDNRHLVNKQDFLQFIHGRWRIIQREPTRYLIQLMDPG